MLAFFFSSRNHLFLFQSNVCSCLLSYLSGLDSKTSFDSVTYPSPLCAEERPRDNSDALRRSYRLMEFFLQKSAYFEKFVETRMTTIITQIFDVFHPKSKGSFFHWSKIFLSLLQKNTMAVRKLFCEEESLFTKMLPYMHEPAVGDTLVHFVAYPSYIQPEREKVWLWVEKQRVLHRILETAFMEGSVVGARSACDFVGRVMDRVATLPGAGRLAAITSKESFVKIVVDTVTSHSHAAEQVEASTELLLKLLNKSEEQIVVESPGAMPQVAYNCFGGANREVLLQMVLPHASRLAETVIETQNMLRMPLPRELEKGAENVPSDLMTVRRLNLVEIIWILVRSKPKQVLPMLHAGFWRFLGKWCDEHPECNIFHVLANKLFEALLRLGDESTHRNVLSKSQLLTRFSRMVQVSLKNEDVSQNSSYNGFLTIDVSVVLLEGLKRGEGSYLFNLIVHTEPWPEIFALMKERAEVLGNRNAWNTELPSKSSSQRQLIQQTTQSLMILPFVHSDIGMRKGDVPTDPAKCFSWLLGYGSEGWEKMPEKKEGGNKKKKKKKKKKKSNNSSAAKDENDDDEDGDDDEK